MISNAPDFTASLGRSVKNLLVANLEYKPDFCPTIGKMDAFFNGCFIEVYVEGVLASVNVHTVETRFSFNIVLEDPGKIAWKDIFQLVLKNILMGLTVQAVYELENLRECLGCKGKNHVQ